MLPKVDRFSVWNEPNLKGLDPADEQPNAAIYRDLVYAAEKGLRTGRQPRAQLLIGEVAPLKSLTFYQQLFCIDSRGRRCRRPPRKAGCKSGRRIKRLKATGIAHHPYDRGGEPPFAGAAATDITLHDIEQLTKVLRAARQEGAVKRNLPIYVTEFGISSDPPSTKFGVSPDGPGAGDEPGRVPAYRERSIRSYTQFQLSDDTGIGREGHRRDFQTGLRFGDDTREARLRRVPDADLRDALERRQPASGAAYVPAPASRVDIQTVERRLHARWSVTVDRYGYIDERIMPRPATSACCWTSRGGQEFTSREAQINAAVAPTVA